MNVQQSLHQSNRESKSRSHLVRNVILLGIGTGLGLALAAHVRTAIRFRRRDQEAINKRWSNRIITTLGHAGQPDSIFALVHHVGRRSGKSYATP